MVALLVILHVIVCVFLVIVVLLQSGKAADLAGAFGGMGSQTAFGPRGSATVLSKATTVAAVVFMVTSLSLAVIQTRSAGGASSVLDRQKSTKKTTVPTAPAPAPGPVQVPVKAAPGAQPKPGQPTMEIIPENGGPARQIPLEIPTAPAPGQQAPPSGTSKK